MEFFSPLSTQLAKQLAKKLQKQWGLSFSVFFTVQSLWASQGAQVLTFSPQGLAKHVSQVHVAFSEPMIPFGDLKNSKEPFDIECQVNGVSLDLKDMHKLVNSESYRWLDAKNLVVDFGHELPSGVRCKFTLKNQIKTLNGEDLKGQRDFSWNTGSPSATLISPYEGSPIQEDQAFVLSFEGGVNAQPTEKFTKNLSNQLTNQIYFLMEGVQDRIPVQQIEGSDRQKILKSIGSPPKNGEENENPAVLLVLQAKRIFPSGAEVSLVIGEEGQKFHFKVRKEFLAEFFCEKENLESGCIPILPMKLSFSNDVPRSEVSKIYLKDTSGKKWKANLEKFDEDPNSKTVRNVRFKGPFPENMEFSLEIPNHLRDESDRELANQNSFPMHVNTDRLPSLAKFPAEFGILESGENVALPVTVRNLDPDGKIRGRILRLENSPENSPEKGPKIESIIEWLQKVKQQGERENRMNSIFTDPRHGTFEIPKPNGPGAFEVVGIPLGKPGFYVVELESQLLGKTLLGLKQPMRVSTAALVTGMGVHFKQGRESSLVWVTSLKDAKPVKNANVEIKDCKGQVLAKGMTGSDGILRIAALPSHIQDCTREGVYSPYFRGVFVTAAKDGDFSFVHSEWNHGIEYWRYNLQREYPPGPKRLHTVFDRVLVRAGDTVHMKHFVRRHSMEGFSPVSHAELPEFVDISHLGSDEKFRFPLKWNADGTAETIWKIPQTPKLGTYTASLLNAPSGEFRVEEFRVPLMKGKILPPLGPLVASREFQVGLSVDYLSAGGASFLPVQFRTQQLKHEILTYPEYEGINFSNGFPQIERGDEVSGDAFSNEGQQKIQKQSLILGKNGFGHTIVHNLKKLDKFTRVLMEMEVRDPNGEVQTTSTTLPLYPSRRLIGVQSISSSEPINSVKFNTTVIDLVGKPLPGASVEVELIELKHYSHRKKLIGGFYAYENRSELEPVGKACDGITDQNGILKCDVTSPRSGSFYLVAKTKDADGNTSIGNTLVYLYGKDRVWFNQEDDERMDIIPEKKRVEPGDIAVFQVKMPFDQATALVTIEREGILNSFVVPISSKKPVIEVPIFKNYSPNIYVSVLAVRGRVGEVQSTAMVDLGKPAYKLGISELIVGWSPHELKVTVTPEKETYQVRQKAKIRIHVSSPEGTPLKEGSKVIVAAVDEGLLQLGPNKSWNLLEAMMSRRGYEVDTYTAQMQVIGKRHFGMKALPHGGGGGGTLTRELFDTLLYWKSDIALDKAGDATVEVPLNDSITSFKIAAIAYSGQNLFGTGFASIRSTQDLMILSGIPPLCRTGDAFPIEFTLRNTTQAPMEVEISGKVTEKNSGKVTEKNNDQLLPSKRVTLSSRDSQVVSWPIVISKQSTSSLDNTVGDSMRDYEIHAKAMGENAAQDHLRISQKVVPVVPVRVYQATLAQIGTSPEKTFKTRVHQPAQALKGKGGIQIAIQPTLMAGVSGVTDFMKNLPYGGFEQRISQAIALSDKALWNKAMTELPTYFAPDGLVKYFATENQEGSDSLTSYVVAIADEAGLSIPKDSFEKMTRGLQGFITGAKRKRKSYSEEREKDLTIRKVAALEALSRTGQATLAMFGSIEVAPQFWPTSAVIDWLSILNRMEKIPDRKTKIQSTEKILQSRLDYQGTRLGFSTDKTDQLSWLMVSPDVNASRLILTLLNSTDWPGVKEDLPKMVKGSLERQSHGHWSTTIANAWGVVAIQKFTQKYEQEKITGITWVELDHDKKQINWNAISNREEKAAGEVLNFGGSLDGKELQIHHKGTGKPWANVKSMAAIPLTAPLFSGLTLHKTWNPIERKKEGQWTKGDRVHIHLELGAQSDVSWVVLNDPIPTGASILGVQNEGNQNRRWQNQLSSVFDERGSDSFRSYFETVPQGKGSVDYIIRLNQSGTFHLPSTRAEGIYSPEIFGEIPNASIYVSE